MRLPPPLTLLFTCILSSRAHILTSNLLMKAWYVVATSTPRHMRSCSTCNTNNTVLSKACCIKEKSLSLIYSNDKPRTFSTFYFNNNQLKHFTLSACYQPRAPRIMGMKTYMWLLVNLKGSESTPTTLMSKFSTACSICCHQAERLVGLGNES